MKKTALLILKIIMYAQAVIWLLFDICSSLVFPLGNYMQNYIIILILMYLNAAAFAVFAYLTRYWKLPVKLLVFLLLMANTILTFTDQIGVLAHMAVFDYIVLVLNLGALVCFMMASFPLRQND